MPTRRQLLSWAALSPIAAAVGHGLTRRLAWAGPPRQAGHVLDAKTRTDIPVVKTGVFSTSNANDQYVAVAELKLLPTDGPILELAHGELVAKSWGSGFGTGAGECSWEVDQATADEIAAVWQIKRQDRTPLGAGLVVHWRAKKQPFTRGKPMTIVAQLENTGTAPVGVQIGGRNFSRDEHFAFTASKGGKALPVIQPGGHAGGGGFYYKVLAAGDKVEVEGELAGWVKITKAGTYQLGCTYVSELVPGKNGPHWPDHGAETWDLSLSGPLTVKVK